MPNQESQKMTLAVTGETLCTRRHSRFTDKAFMDLVARIREADCAQTNLETRIHTFKGYPMPVDTMGSAQSYQQADPFVAQELKWMGFDMIARSNNHGMDYGPAMLKEEAEHLDAAGFVHAGAGMTMSEATQPAYFETPMGRVALISVTTDFPPHCPAGEQRHDIGGRPGVNTLHIDKRFTLSSDDFAHMRGMIEQFELPRAIRETKLNAFGEVFHADDTTEVTYTPRQSDLDRNLRQIREAKRAADYVMVHLHQATRTKHRPADHIQELSHALIDGGASIIVGDGPHLLQGIEIYKGAPIFYSLGNFFYQSETIKLFPADFYERNGLGPEATPQDALDERDAIRSGKKVVDNTVAGRTGDSYMRWFETMLAEVDFDGDRLSEIRLTPLWTHHDKRSQRGLPRVADAEKGTEILENMRRYSQEFGTEISISDGRGVISVPT
ncbi:MAG: CapA family protein [Cognatishimia sp.]